ncbi:hypothetical protein VPH35_052164 [Triticum aestivum]
MFLIIYKDHMEVPRPQSCITEQMGWFAPHRNAIAPPLRQGGCGIVLLLHVSSSRCELISLNIWRHPPLCCVATPLALPRGTVVAGRLCNTTAAAIAVARAHVQGISLNSGVRHCHASCNTIDAAGEGCCSGASDTAALQQHRYCKGCCVCTGPDRASPSTRPPKLHWNTSAAIGYYYVVGVW